MDAFKRAHSKCAKQEIGAARKQGDFASRADEIHLNRPRLGVAFLLGLLRCRDSLAETARMPAVERLRNRQGERRPAGILHQH